MQLRNKNLFRQQCYVDGKWIDADNKKTFSVENPFDQSILGSVPECGASETKRAIEAAQSAFEKWRMLTAKQRSELMWRWAALIEENKEDLATLMTLEQGKPITEARGEIDYSNAFVKWFAEEGRRVYGD